MPYPNEDGFRRFLMAVTTEIPNGEINLGGEMIIFKKFQPKFDLQVCIALQKY